jgi:hypothetical protein
MRLREKIYLAWLLFPPATWIWNLRHKELLKKSARILGVARDEEGREKSRATP